MLKKLKPETKKEILIIAILILIQTIFFVVAGLNKFYLHMDEIYSYGLTHYDVVQIYEHEGFFHNWHDSEFFKEYLEIKDKDKGNFLPVYENQKNDVHPPLYYLLLRLSMQLNVNNFSIWSGIILNIIIYAFITIFIYLICKKLFKNNIVATIITLLSAISMAALSSVIFIRMYVLATLLILIISYLHIKLLENKGNKKNLYVLIGITALLGSLTHYYFLFYLVALVIMFIVKFIKQKQYKNLKYYLISIVSAGILSLVIFPYSIKHLFFEHRGQSAFGNLLNVPQFAKGFFSYIEQVNVFVFNNLLYILLISIIALIIYGLVIKNNKNTKTNNEIITFKVNKEINYIPYLIIPTFTYFTFVAIVAPWTSLRYIMPICALIFIIAVYYLLKLIKNINIKSSRQILTALFGIMFLISPIIYHIHPDTSYPQMKGVVQEIKEEYNVPALYMFNKNDDYFWVMDTVLLFANLDNTYISKDLECNEENIKNIFNNKDTTKGILFFVNSWQNKNDMVNIIKNALQKNNAKEITLINNNCSVIYIN